MGWTMPSHSWGVIAVFIPMLIAGISSFSLTAQSTNGCYGIGVAGRDFLTPSCNAGQMMAIEYIKLGAKRDDSGCPKEANAQPVSHKDTCCSYDGATSDRHCFFDFTRNQTYFAEICLGRSQCLSIANQLRVDREQTTGGVCHSDYLDYSNYMVMSYYCIPDTQRIDEDQSASRTSTSVYLHSKDYPQSKMKQRTPEQIGVCSISAAACDARIRTSILDVRLSTGSGSCSKAVTINDGSNAVSISCNEDTLFVRENVYISTSNFLTLDIVNQVTGGIFFLEFDSDDGSQITLACGGSALRTSPTTNCTTIPPGTNTFSTATTTTEKPFEITKEGYMAMAYTFIALFLLLLCYYLLFQVVFLCYKCYKEGRFCFKTCNGVKANTVGPNGKDSMKNLPPLNHQFGANGLTPSQRNAAAHPGNSQVNGLTYSPSNPAAHPDNSQVDRSDPTEHKKKRKKRKKHRRDVSPSQSPRDDNENRYRGQPSPYASHDDEPPPPMRNFAEEQRPPHRLPGLGRDLPVPPMEQMQYFRENDDIPRVYE